MKDKAHRKDVKEARLVRKKNMSKKGTVGKIEGKVRNKISKKLGI